MAEVIRMPKMSDTMEEGVIAAWLKKEGDTISSGDVIAEVETDKATMELESYEDGELLHIAVAEKQAVAIDGVIAIIGEKGEDISALLDEVKNNNSPNKTASSETETSPKATPQSEEEESTVDISNINATVVLMPKMSDTMEQGVIATWTKNVGDQVNIGDILAEVETDKATMELEAYDEGTLLYQAVEAGHGVPVDGVIAIVGAKDADYKTLLKHSESKKKKAEAPTHVPQENIAVKTEEKAPLPAVDETASQNLGRIKASPLAKKIAKEKGLDLSKIKGTGDHGRIIRRDVENYVPAKEQATDTNIGVSIPYANVVGEEKTLDLPLSQMRKTIARRLSESKFTAPHFYLTMEIHMDKVMAARKSMNELAPVKISFNDIVVKAAAHAIRQNPDINVSWSDTQLKKHQHIHVGVAVAIPDGLVVPVVKFTDSKSLSMISAEVKNFAIKAKEKKLQQEDFQGNTFTISNLGMFGIDAFTAIINFPESCILAVGGIKETAVVKNGTLTPGHVMKVTLSCDHRAVDGAVGAAFLKTFKELLEDPVRMLI